MLRKFSVTNYKNFKEKITFDFSNPHDYRFNNNCIKNGIVNKALIMGKNGCGKTNLGFALFDISLTLTDNLSHPYQSDSGSFLNGYSDKKEASFDYEFQFEESVIKYSYRKTEPFKLTFESLFVDDECIFEFDFNSKKHETEGLSILGAENLRIDMLDGRISALRYIANNTPIDLNSPLQYIMNFANNMLYFRSCQDGNMFIGHLKSGYNMDQYIIENNLVEDFQNFLNESAELDLKLDIVKDVNNSALVQVFDNKRLLFAPIASSGTKALQLYYTWSKLFEKLSFLFIDEFDAYYHFELAQEILKKTIENNIQTVFTSHNTILVNNDFMRPDCYFIIQNNSISSFSDNTDRELREAHNIEKMLRNGEFDE